MLFYVPREGPTPGLEIAISLTGGQYRVEEIQGRSWRWGGMSGPRGESVECSVEVRKHSDHADVELVIKWTFASITSEARQSVSVPKLSDEYARLPKAVRPTSAGLPATLDDYIVDVLTHSASSV